MNQNLDIFSFESNLVIKYKINIFQIFQTNMMKHCWDIGMPKSLFFSVHNCTVVGKIVRRLLEIKFMMTLLASSRNAGNLKLFWF